MNDVSKILTGVVFLVVAISLPVTIFLVNTPQNNRPEATEIESAAPTQALPAGCPAVNPDGTSNTCRAQEYCNAGETVKYDGNEMCSTSLGRTAYCCTSAAPTQ